MDRTLMAVVLILTLGFSCFFAAIRTAYTKYSKTRMKALAAEGNEQAKRVLALDEKKDELIAALQAGSSFSRVLMAIMAAGLFARYRELWIMAVVVAAVALLLAFGEMMMKTIAQERPEGLAMATERALTFLMGLFKPLDMLLLGWNRFVSRRFASHQAAVVFGLVDHGFDLVLGDGFILL